MLHTKNFKFKTTFLAVSALTLAMGASAQSSVQVYGVVDAAISNVSGLAGGSKTQVVSGMMEGSRLGFRGTEDIGGGFRTIFVLEQRVESNTGSMSNDPLSGTALPARLSTPAGLGLPPTLGGLPTSAILANVNPIFGAQLGVNKANKFFDRQSFVGLVTPVGAFIVGRQYTPAFEALASFDAMKTESALSASQVASIPAGLDIRQDKAFQYRIQLDGITASLMTTLTGDSVSKANRLRGGMVNYKTEGYSLGIGYNTRNNELGRKSLTNTIVGATYDLGPGTVSFMSGSIKDENPTGLSGIAAALISANAGLAPIAPTIQSAYINASKQDARLTNIGYKFPMGRNTITLAYTSLNDKTAANADVASYGFAVTHALSKRTDLNFVFAQVDNKERGQAVAGGNGYLGGVSSAPGVDSRSISFGLRHRF
jgi:predicted porin